MPYAAMDKQLDAFSEEDDPDWIVLRPARFERWHVDALVVGPPGIFLIWPIWGSAELGLWQSAQLCRRYLAESLGADFRGAVEVVYFRDRGPRQSYLDQGQSSESSTQGGPVCAAATSCVPRARSSMSCCGRGDRPRACRCSRPSGSTALRPIGYPLGLSVNLQGPQPDAQRLPLLPEIIDWPPPT